MRVATSARRWSVSIALLVVLILSSLPALAATATFENTTTISIADSGVATPYPSTIDVSGLTGTISDVNVTLTNLSHGYPNDIHVLLVGPTGQTVLLMRNNGTSAPVSNITLTFDDAAASPLPGYNESPLTSGTFQPSPDQFLCSSGAPTEPAAPAPAGPHGTTLSVFNDTDPNGTWSLYFFDDCPGDGGSIAGGWSLTITTPDTTPPTIEPIPDQTLDPTSPAGAVVTFTTVVADNETPTDQIVVSCVDQNSLPFVSGQVAPIGVTTITCTVTDGAGNTASTSFTVTVLGSGDLFDELQSMIVALDVVSSTERTLLTQAALAEAFANGGQTGLSCVQLTALDATVKSQESRRRISGDDAAAIYAQTQQLRSVIGCGGITMTR